MTTEELEKEAEDYVSKYQGWGWTPHEGSAVYNAMLSSYIDSAESREKRIAELERKLKVETELSNRLGLAYREYEQLTKEQDEHLAELGKENAELKEKCQNRCDECWEEHIKLTKAKEALESISKLASDLYASGYSSKKIAECIQDKIEQFLSEVEK